MAESTKCPWDRVEVPEPGHAMCSVCGSVRIKALTVRVTLRGRSRPMRAFVCMDCTRLCSLIRWRQGYDGDLPGWATELGPTDDGEG